MTAPNRKGAYHLTEGSLTEIETTAFMKFFFPGISSFDRACGAYAALANRCRALTGWPVTPASVFALRYRAEGSEWLAQVGLPHPPAPGQGPVVAILHAPQGFLICRESLQKEAFLPLAVSRGVVSDVEFFNGVDDAIRAP